MGVTLQPARDEDREFLYKLYVSTRLAEIAPFGWDQVQQEAFLRMQFNAQRNWYATAYPSSEEQIVTVDEAPVGRMYVHRSAGVATLVDISLLPEHRGRGIGGGLVRGLAEECGKQRLLLRLQVLRNNPAARLYERIGFRKTGETEIYLQMEKLPD